MQKRSAELVGKLSESIRAKYQDFSPEERTKLFARIYDYFAETYDRHMGVETNHYGAINKLLLYAAPQLRLPLIDITAGTGEPLRCALDIIDASTIMGSLRRVEGGGTITLPTPEEIFLFSNPGEAIPLPLRRLFMTLPEEQRDTATPAHLVYANEISEKMREKAAQKLEGYQKIKFTNHDANDLPCHLAGRFRSAMCTQTLHLVSDEDKIRIIKSMHKVLAPGGIALVVEEDPFRISPTAPIERVRLLISSIASPIRNRGDLIGLFKANGFERLEDRAVAPIDEHHVMRVYLFKKPCLNKEDREAT